MKSSFTVMFESQTSNTATLITGVTSVVPNLNGFLFFTEDGENYQIESHELIDNGLSGISFEYFSDEDIEDLKRFARNTVHDHRKTKVEKTPMMSDYYKTNGTHLGQTTRKRGQS